jgi:hypothetical protein
VSRAERFFLKFAGQRNMEKWVSLTRKSTAHHEKSRPTADLPLRWAFCTVDTKTIREED